MRLDDVGRCPQKPHLSAPVVSQQAGSRNEGGGYVDGVSSLIHHSLRVHSRSLRKERGRLSGRKARNPVQPGLLALLALRGPQEERSFASSMENVVRSARLHARLTNVSSMRLR